MESIEKPFSMHDLEERPCAYCGELFYATHGLQQYCPDKFGKINYCKYEQKKMMTEKKLAEAAEKLHKAGINVYSDQDPIEKNIGILAEQLGPYGQTTVISTALDSKGYSMQHYTARVSKNGSNDFVLVVGPYALDWIGQNGDILTFKITKS
jgi:hypothetical protein